MNPRSLISLSAWQDFLIEKFWQVTERPVHVTEPSWKLDPEKLSNARIKWPQEYNYPPLSKWGEPIKAGLRRWVQLENAPIPQPSDTAFVFELWIKDKAFRIALDPFDLPRVRDDVVEESLLYFKMQYQKGGYESSSILPAGYIANDSNVYHYLSALREIKDSSPAIYQVYGRFSLEFAEDIRLQALEILNSQERFSFEGSPKKIRYSRFLQEVAKSSVCIDLPGNGSLCFRLIDYMALGSCIIGPPHEAQLHVPLVDREHIVYAKPNLSDLVDLCAYYLKNEDERELIATQSRDYFDRYLHQEQLGAYYLSKCFERV